MPDSSALAYAQMSTTPGYVPGLHGQPFAKEKSSRPLETQIFILNSIHYSVVVCNGQTMRDVRGQTM